MELALLSLTWAIAERLAGEIQLTEHSQSAEDGFIYDAIVMRVDVSRKSVIFSVAELSYCVRSPHVECFSAGAVGRLRLPTDQHGFAFQTYADQRLRRAPELDDLGARRWGWRIGPRSFTVKLGLIPGRNGAVVPNDTDSVQLEVPREFLQFCESRDLVALQVLRAFIGDLCDLANVFERPREDGYSSAGPAARDQARAYLESAFSSAPECRPESSETPSTDQPRRRKRSRLSIANAGEPTSDQFNSDEAARGDRVPSVVAGKPLTQHAGKRAQSATSD
jgi:hypothetical protein